MNTSATKGKRLAVAFGIAALAAVTSARAEFADTTAGNVVGGLSAPVGTCYGGFSQVWSDLYTQLDNEKTFPYCRRSGESRALSPNGGFCYTTRKSRRDGQANP